MISPILNMLALNLVNEATQLWEGGHKTSASDLLKVVMALHTNNVEPYIRFSGLDEVNRYKGELMELILLIDFYERYGKDDAFISSIIKRRDKLLNTKHNDYE